MAYEQLYRGLLQFPDADAFERALDGIRKERGDRNEIDWWKGKMISPTVFVLDEGVHAPATWWESTMLELYELAGHACHGYVVGLIRVDGGISVGCAGSSAMPPFLPNDPPLPLLPPEEDFFAITPGKTLVYASQGAETPYIPHWHARHETDPPGAYFSIPDLQFPGDTLNERWNGDLFLKDGPRLYDVFAVSVHGVPGRKREFPTRYAWMIGDNNAKPGDTWVANTANDLLYLYVVEAFEDVETPFGLIRGAMRIRREQWSVNTYQDFYEIYPWDAHQNFNKIVDFVWFARGLGLVKIHETATGVIYSLAEIRA